MAARANKSTIDEIHARLRGEFISDAADRLDRVEQMIEQWRDGAIEDLAILAEVRREAHSIKGMGGTFGFPVMSSIAHRLEDYLANVTALTPRHVEEGYRFIDALRGIVEGGEEPGSEESADILRRLPAKWFDTIEATMGVVEILVGVNSRVMQSAIERDVYALGYRVISTKSAVDVLQLAVTMSPNGVIVAAVMPDLSGLDVVRALGAMEKTRDIPVGLLTSLSDGQLKDRPSGTIIIRKDSDGFTKGLTEMALRIKVRDSVVVNSLTGGA